MNRRLDPLAPVLGVALTVILAGVGVYGAVAGYVPEAITAICGLAAGQAIAIVFAAIRSRR
jgi:hypothetical protein